tara:strand:- start:3119 stop:3352 length:234 start_codon:yes stop_codon:yes gene_type:complete
MRTYISTIFYFLGDLTSKLLQYSITSVIFYPIYRRLMLISISLDKNNIVWENAEKKESARVDFIARLKNENRIRYKR